MIHRSSLRLISVPEELVMPGKRLIKYLAETAERILASMHTICNVWQTQVT